MYNRTQVKLEAKAAMKENLGLSMGIFIVFTLIIGAMNAIPGIGSIAAVVLTGVFSVGFSFAFLKIVRRNEVEFSEMFSGFNNFGNNCLAGVLVGIFTFLWSLLFIIPGIIKGISYSMTYYILADHPELTAQQAIKESQRIMDGHKMDYFVLILSFILWDLLVSVTCGIAIIYVGPYQSAAKARFYDVIKDERPFGM